MDRYEWIDPTGPTYIVTIADSESCRKAGSEMKWALIRELLRLAAENERLRTDCPCCREYEQEKERAETAERERDEARRKLQEMSRDAL